MIAKQLSSVASSAARAKGKKPSKASLNNTISNALGVKGFEADQAVLLKKEEDRATKDIRSLLRDEDGNVRRGFGSFTSAGTKGKGVDLDFAMESVFEDENGVFFQGKPKKEGGPPTRIPLTVEQERVYRLQKKVRTLEENLEEDYGEDFSIDTIIERGRDIYARNYAPISKDKLDNIYRQNYLETLNEKQRELFLAIESVEQNDKTVRDFMRGRLDVDDPMYKYVSQVLSAGKQGQQVDPVALANSLFDDPDEARRAVGTAMRVELLSMQDKKIKPAKVSEEKEADAEKTKKDFGDRLDFDLGPLRKTVDGIGDFFAGRMKGKEEVPKEQPTEIPTIEDVEFDESGGLVNPEAIAAEPVAQPKAPITQLEIGTVVKKNPAFKYGYEIISIKDGVPTFKTTGTAAGKKMKPAMIDEAMIAYQKELERLNAEQK